MEKRVVLRHCHLYAGPRWGRLRPWSAGAIACRQPILDKCPNCIEDKLAPQQPQARTAYPAKSTASTATIRLD